jgi:HK97 family phage major capsid protein
MDEVTIKNPMAASTLPEIREARASIKTQLDDLYNRAEKEKRPMTDDEDRQFNSWYEDLTKLNARMETMQKAADLRSLHVGDQEPIAKPDKADPKKAYEEAFRAYLWGGMSNLDQAQKMLLANNAQSGIVKAANVTPQYGSSATLGGYTIPEGFSNELEMRMKWYGGMLQAARMYRTETGNPIPWPTMDDTGNTGAWLNDEASPTIAEQNLTFGQKKLEAWTVHSKIVPISIQLLQDSYFDLVGELTGLFAERLGRVINTGLTTGDNDEKPNGIVTALTAGGRVINAADDVTISRADLIDVMFHVDKAYQNRPNSAYMFHNSTLAAILKLSNGTGDDRPLWQPSMREGEPDRINGVPYWINNDMGEIGKGLYSIIYGDFSKYVYRIVGNPGVFRMDEKYIEKLHYAYLAFMRVDGECLQENAFAILRHPNT